MRSLLLAPTFLPALGGIETLLYQTARRLTQQPVVIAHAPAYAAEMTVIPVSTTLLHRVIYRPTWFLHPALYYMAAFWQPAVRAIVDHRPRVLQVGHVYLAPLARVLARRFKLRYVVYTYGQEVWRAGRPVGRRVLDDRLRGAALSKADALLTLGPFTASLLADWHVPPQRVVCVPFGADPRPEIVPPAGKTVLSVARLVPRKGIDTVIRALPRLDAAVTYRVVGSGPDEPRLRSLALQERVDDRVTFLGRIDDAVLAEEYQRCAVFAMPSQRTADGELEGLGLVYFEAAAWGRPVIAGRSGGEVDAVLDGETGLLVHGDSVDEVASALDRLLRSPDLLRKLGAAGRQRVEMTHNWSCAAAVVDDVLAWLA